MLLKTMKPMSECDTRKFLFLSSIGYFQRLLKLKNLACLIGWEQCCFYELSNADETWLFAEIPVFQSFVVNVLKLDNATNIFTLSDHSEPAAREIPSGLTNYVDGRLLILHTEVVRLIHRKISVNNIVEIKGKKYDLNDTFNKWIIYQFIDK